VLGPDASISKLLLERVPPTGGPAGPRHPRTESSHREWSRTASCVYGTDDLGAPSTSGSWLGANACSLDDSPGLSSASCRRGRRLRTTRDAGCVFAARSEGRSAPPPRTLPSPMGGDVSLCLGEGDTHRHGRPAAMVPALPKPAPQSMSRDRPDSRRALRSSRTWSAGSIPGA